jgi:hypothetical protein
MFNIGPVSLCLRTFVCAPAAASCSSKVAPHGRRPLSLAPDTRSTLLVGSETRSSSQYISLGPAEGQWPSGTTPCCKKTFFSADADISGEYDFFLQILDRLLRPTNFPHKHHGAIPSRYTQIREGEFGGLNRWRTTGFLSV